MTRSPEIPPEFQALADAIMNMRDAAANLDAAKAAVRDTALPLVPAAKAIDPDFQILGLGPALAATEAASSYATALEAHYQFDKVRRALRLPKPSTAAQRGPGGGR